jgi:hypothetical protein
MVHDTPAHVACSTNFGREPVMLSMGSGCNPADVPHSMSCVATLLLGNSGYITFQVPCGTFRSTPFPIAISWVQEVFSPFCRSSPDPHLTVGAVNAWLDELSDPCQGKRAHKAAVLRWG